MKEEWRDIKGFEGYYQISNMGRVKSLERMKRSGLNGGCYVTVPEKILEGVDNGYGYLQVSLSKDGKDKNYLVHRLVAQAFISNPNNLPEVNHISEDKSDNKAENLEWCGRAYNINYGTRNQRMAEKNSKPIFSVDKESGLIMWWQSAREASRQTGIAQSSISACLKGRKKSAGGHIWFYAD